MQILIRIYQNIQFLSQETQMCLKKVVYETYIKFIVSN